MYYDVLSMGLRRVLVLHRLGAFNGLRLDWLVRKRQNEVRDRE